VIVQSRILYVYAYSISDLQRKVKEAVDPFLDKGVDKGITYTVQPVVITPV
jgi:hypothetical protein